MPDIFLSYDSSDEYWRARFDDVFGHSHPCRVVRADAMPTDGGLYAHELRDKGYLTPETVLLVLIGPRTYSSRKVDWEVAAALHDGDTRPAGILAVRLPTHEDYRKGKVNARRIPHRIADNLRSGFLKLYDWTESDRELENRLYAALKDARGRAHLVQNSRALMERDLFR